MNDSEIYQYLIHLFCPLDYCHPSSTRVEINLNLPNGYDAQCANHCTGLLCGACQSGLSLSLGSLHCICCPSHWPVSLACCYRHCCYISQDTSVIFILLFNLTVSVGILNAIIFYASILEIRNSSNILTSNFDVASLLVSLNLEASFDVCFFGGMDAF